MSSKYKLRKSRDKWTQKAVERGEQLRYQRRENVRIKKERDMYKARERELKKQLEKERQKNNLPVPDKKELVYVSLVLFLVARISFCAVSKVLGVLSSYLGIPKAPCTQTIINTFQRFPCNILKIIQLFAISFVRFYRAVAADAMYTYFCGEPVLFRLCQCTALSEKFCGKEFFAAGSEAL